MVVIVSLLNNRVLYRILVKELPNSSLASHQDCAACLFHWRKGKSLSMEAKMKRNFKMINCCGTIMHNRISLTQKVNLGSYVLSIKPLGNSFGICSIPVEAGVERK